MGFLHYLPSSGPGHWDRSSQERGGKNHLSQACGEGWGELPQMCVGPADLLGSGAIFPCARVQTWASAIPWVVTSASDSNADNNCSGTTGLDMVLCSSLAWIIPWPQGAVHATEVVMVLKATCLSDSSMVTSGSPGVQGSCGLWWQHGPWTSPWSQVAIEPWTQTWSSAASQASMPPWPQVAARAIQIGITPAAKWPSDHSMAHGAAEIMGIRPVFDEP